MKPYIVIDSYDNWEHAQTLTEATYLATEWCNDGSEEAFIYHITHHVTPEPRKTTIKEIHSVLPQAQE